MFNHTQSTSLRTWKRKAQAVGSHPNRGLSSLLSSLETHPTRAQQPKPKKRTQCHKRHALCVVVVGKHFTFLLVVQWEIHTYLLKFKFLLPFQRQPSLCGNTKKKSIVDSIRYCRDTAGMMDWDPECSSYLCCLFGCEALRVFKWGFNRTLKRKLWGHLGRDCHSDMGQNRVPPVNISIPT